MAKCLNYNNLTHGTWLAKGQPRNASLTPSAYLLMNTRNRITAIAVAVIMVSAVGCSDPAAVTAPSPAPNQNLLSGLLGTATGLLQKKAVKWTEQPAAVSVSGYIGRTGGTLSVPQADFRIDFPSGAVDSTTKITVTVVNGDYVTYDMLPHGINFRVPVVVKQGLHNTAAYDSPDVWPTLTGTYVLSDLVPDLLGLFNATEILPSNTYFIIDRNGVRHPDYQVWQIKHFSRYMLASG